MPTSGALRPPGNLWMAELRAGGSIFGFKVLRKFFLARAAFLASRQARSLHKRGIISRSLRPIFRHRIILEINDHRRLFFRALAMLNLT